MKYIFLLFSLVVSNQSINAQEEERFDRIEAILVAHITKALDLSKEEAEKFWPIFNGFSKKEFELRTSQRKLVKSLNAKMETITDKEITDFNSKLDKLRDDLYKNENDLYKQLKGVILDKKILKLKIARENFQKHLLHKLRHKRRG
jgi:hypothetical protein